MSIFIIHYIISGRLIELSIQVHQLIFNTIYGNIKQQYREQGASIVQIMPSEILMLYQAVLSVCLIILGGVLSILSFKLFTRGIGQSFENSKISLLTFEFSAGSVGGLFLLSAIAVCYLAIEMRPTLETGEFAQVKIAPSENPPPGAEPLEEAIG